MFMFIIKRAYDLTFILFTCSVSFIIVSRLAIFNGNINTGSGYFWVYYLVNRYIRQSCNQF